MASDMPLRTFSGWTRQLRRVDLNKMEATVLDLAFPHFENGSLSDLETRERHLHSIGIDNTQRLASIEAIGSRGFFVRQRRYAGGLQFPPGSYYSVCRAQDGFDYNTLCAELSTYVDDRIPGEVFVYDSNDHELAQQIGLTGGDMSNGQQAGVFVLLFAPSKPADRAVWCRYFADILKFNQAPSSAVCCFLPTSVRHLEIPKTIDLREPESQLWFFNYFTRSTGLPFAKAGRNRVPSFYHMLPELTNPERGGTETTHGIGTWLLANDVNGFVFPSARNTVGVSMLDGHMTDFVGWSLLDYRLARQAGLQGGRFGDLNRWRTFKEHQADCSVDSGSLFAGSWRMVARRDWYREARQQVIDSGFSVGDLGKGGAP